jgi:hypothetical protein
MRRETEGEDRRGNKERGAALEEHAMAFLLRALQLAAISQKKRKRKEKDQVALNCIPFAQNEWQTPRAANPAPHRRGNAQRHGSCKRQVPPSPARRTSKVVSPSSRNNKKKSLLNRQTPSGRSAHTMQKAPPQKPERRSHALSRTQKQERKKWAGNKSK